MFSRVIPLQEGRPEQHPMWRKAIKFGATCTTQPSDAVTHVAAYVNGTEKVRSLFPAASDLLCIERVAVGTALQQWYNSLQMCRTQAMHCMRPLLRHLTMVKIF